MEFTITSGSSYNNDLHLSVDDIHVDRTKPSKYMLVNIKTSKTDRIRKGFNLLRAVSFTLGSTICAVRAVLDYFHRQRNRAGPVSIHQDGRGFTRPTLSKRLQATAICAGLAGKFSGHIFRIGAATTAAQNGIPDHLIKTLGR